MVDMGTKVHKHGYVELLDHMGSDSEVVYAARMSYDQSGRKEGEDRGLIRYLLRHKHTSPFEMAVVKLELKMPVFVARQWVRHRTASMNEVSARYTQLPNEMFIPEVFALQSTDNKQGRGDNATFDIDSFFTVAVGEIHEKQYDLYEDMLEQGIARELARGVLPFNIYTKFVWQMNLHNLMHFLHLRLDSHAQQEIRDFAEAIESIVAELFPLCHEAFVDYVRDSYTCSRMEVELLRHIAWVHVNLHNTAELPALTQSGRLASMDAMAKNIGMSKREIVAFNKRFLPDD